MTESAAGWIWRGVFGPAELLAVLSKRAARRAPHGNRLDANRLYRWHWHARLPERHGQLLRVLVKSHAMNSCLIQFLDDGFCVVTSRNALRKA